MWWLGLLALIFAGPLALLRLIRSLERLESVDD